MRKLDLKDWAALGELVATVAVVVSLIFVVVSVKQNTDALQGVNDNAVFQQHAEVTSLFISDPSFAAILANKRSGTEEFTEVEAIRWERYEMLMLDVWVMAFTRHQAGLIADEHWAPWDEYFTYIFSRGDEKLTPERFYALRFGYEPEFWST